MTEQESNDGEVRADAAAYLASALQMDPMNESHQIVALRSQVFGLHEEGNVSTAELDEENHRAAALEKLQAIRGNLWTEPLESLTAQLDELNTQEFPELREPVHRIRLVLRNREKILNLDVPDRFAEDFMRHLKDLLAASPRDSAVLREQLLVAFRNRKNRKQGKPFVERLRRELPEVYTLEKTFLEDLSTQRARRTVNGVPKAEGRSTWWWWIVAFIGFRILVNAIGGSSD